VAVLPQGWPVFNSPTAGFMIRDGSPDVLTATSDGRRTWTTQTRLPWMDGMGPVSLDLPGSTGWALLETSQPGTAAPPRYRVAVTRDQGAHWTYGALPAGP
jgi:hypothetical protein